MHLNDTSGISPAKIIALLFLSTLTLHSTKVNAYSLCKSYEKTVFSCTLENSKIASICENSELTQPFLEYRFGKPAKIELTYRASKEDRRRIFHRADVIGANNTVDSIWFKKDGHIYDVSLPARGAPGVQVWKQGEMLANLECNDGWTGTEGKRQTKSAFIIDHGSVDPSQLDMLWYEEQ